jgi:hypothetical protein
MSLTIDKGIGLGLLISGLGIFWFAAAFGMHHFIPNGLLDGVIITISLLLAGFGLVVLRIEKNTPPKAVLDSLILFLSLNSFLFEISLYFNPYPNYWWTRQAADWIALIGLGNIITNEFVFAVSLLILSARVLLITQKRVIFRRQAVSNSSREG